MPESKRKNNAITMYCARLGVPMITYHNEGHSSACSNISQPDVLLAVMTHGGQCGLLTV